MTVDDYEALRRLKAQYCHRIDDKDWEGFGELFLEGATFSYGGAGVEVVNVYEGRDAIVQHMIDELSDIASAHHVTSSELELISETEARGRWGAFYMQAGGRLIGSGTYRERYRKTPDGWRFEKIEVEQRMVTVTHHAGLMPLPPQ